MIGTTGDRKLFAALSLALVLASVFIYHRTVTFGFVNYDDPYLILDNPPVRSGLSMEGVRWAFGTFHASNWMPLTWLSHMLDVRFFGLEPGGHHLTSLILHTVNAVLLFAVLRAMTGALWRSFLVAALFTVHPLHVEAVAWAAARRDLLSTFFWLLSMGAYCHYASRPGATRYLLVVAPFVLGLLSKPMLITLPFVLLLLDYWPLERLSLRAATGEAGRRFPSVTWKKAVTEKAPLIVLAALSGAVTYAAQAAGGAVKSAESFPLAARVANASSAYVKYLVKTFLPTGLAVLYPHPGADYALWKGALPALLLAVATILAVRYAGRCPFLPVGWFWYLGTLLPVIGLVQIGIQSMADRYTYITLTGIFILFSWGLHGMLSRRKYGLFSAAPAAAALVALSILARIQVGYWQDSVTLFERALAVTSDNFVAHNNLGNALSNGGREREAVQHYLESVRLKPDYDKAYNNLGIALDRLGMTSQAIAAYNRAIAVSPRYAEARFNLGLAHISAGDLGSARMQYQALRQFDAAAAGRLLRFIQYSTPGSP